MKMKTLLVGLLFAAVFFQVFMVLILDRQTPLGFGSAASVGNTEVTVPDDYTTIQAAINAANQGDIIFVRNGTYPDLNIVVNKSLTIVGENAQNTTIDGGGTADFVFQVLASNVVIENFTLRDTSLSQSGPAIRLYNVTNVSVRNVVTQNTYYGLEFRSSNFSETVDCDISGSFFSGIYLYAVSCNNTFVGNTIKNNSYGIYMQFTEQFNKVYRNNFINNTRQIQTLGYPNYFDNGYPSGGNYWSDHVASDLNYTASQDVTGSDGILDEGYGEDRYPLVNPLTHFYVFAENSQTFLVDVSANVTMTECILNTSRKSLNLFANSSLNDCIVCRVHVPKALLSCENLTDWNVTVSDDDSTQTPAYLALEDVENTYLYFVYDQTAMTIRIEVEGAILIPEFPSVLTALLLSTSVLTVLMAFKKRYNGCVNERKIPDYSGGATMSSLVYSSIIVSGAALLIS